MTTTAKHPSWWTKDHSTSWEKVKEAFHRDWEQTKADLSKKAGHELNQNIGDTVKQAAGKEVIPAGNAPNPSQANFDDFAPALQLGHAARLQYGKDHKQWNEGLETKLQKDWDSVGANRGWSDVKDYVRKGFDGNGSL
jgi:hypothetical protein